MPELTTHDLIADENGVRAIEIKAQKSLTEKIAFAWEVADSKNQYTEEVQNEALGYLKMLYSLPDDLVEKTTIMEQLKKRIKTLPESPKPILTAQLQAAPMKLVPQISGMTFLRSFLDAINDDVLELNLLINRYNKTHGTPQKITMLQQIYRKKVQIENTYNDTDVTQCADYRNEIQHNLFVELQKQFVSLGVMSMEGVVKQAPVTQNQPVLQAHTLSEILANMSPEKATKMLEVLARADASAFEKLYDSNEPGYEEYLIFLKTHAVTFLGGGNSKNFKITPGDGSPPFVLKVDNRMGMSKSAEAHLREHSLKEVFTSVGVERQVTGRIPVKVKHNNQSNLVDKLATRTLLVTEFCSGGDIQSHSKVHGFDEKARLNAALDIYQQMGTILSGITRDGCAFPDMKNSNWLVNDKGLLRLADTKSFVFIEENGDFDYKKNKKRWCRFITSPHMDVPELQYEQFSANNMHAMLLGKNLYQYLTGCKSKYLEKQFDSETYDFSASIFDTSEGRELELLIKNLITPEPAGRLAINDAVSDLRRIATGPAHLLAFERNLKAVKGNILPPGEQSHAFFEEQIALARLADTPDKLDSLNHKLIQTNTCLLILKSFYTNANGSEYALQVNAFLLAREQLILQAETPENFQAIKHDLHNIVPKIIRCIPVLYAMAKGSCRDYPKIDAFIVERKKDLMALKTPELFVLYKSVLQLMPIRLSKCDQLLKELGNDADVQEFVEQAHNDLMQARTLEDFDPIMSKLEALIELKKQLEKQFAEELKNCEQRLDTLKNATFTNDAQMDTFVEKMTSELTQARTPDELLAISSKLEAIKNDPQTRAVWEIIASFRADDAWYTVGMSAKADRIQAAMLNVPVEERGNIMQGASPEARLVRMALASHRHFWQDDTYLDAKDNANAEQIASSFLLFKSKFKGEIDTLKTAAVGEVDESSALNVK